MYPERHFGGRFTKLTPCVRVQNGLWDLLKAASGELDKWKCPPKRTLFSGVSRDVATSGRKENTSLSSRLAPFLPRRLAPFYSLYPQAEHADAFSLII